MFPFCECAGICEFEQDSSLFPNIVLTAEVNAQVERARGGVVTPKLYRKLGYRAYFQSVFGYLGRGVRHPPKPCLLELIRAEWPEPHGASDHVGFYDAPQEDGGHRLLIRREVNEDNTVGVQDAVAKPTTEVMTIKIAAVVTMDDADAVDCRHGEDKALEATKRSSAVIQDAVAKPTTEVMTIKIAAVVTMDDTDAVDFQHGEDKPWRLPIGAAPLSKIP
jgi:hypothetical protein